MGGRCRREVRRPDPGNRLQHFARPPGVGPLQRVLGHQRLQHRGERSGAPGLRQRFADDRRQRGPHRRTAEGRRALHGRVQRHAERPDVRRGTRFPALCAFRRQIVEGADDLTALGQLGQGLVAGGLHAGDAEVGEYDPAAALKQYVAGLDVPVEDPGPVCRVERVHQLGADRRRFTRVQWAALRQHVVEGGPVDQLHDDDRPPLLLDHVVHGDHTAVPDTGGGLRLPLHPDPQIGQFGRGGVGVGPQDLDGDLAVQQLVHRPGDHTHATAPDHRGHEVPPAQSLADQLRAVRPRHPSRSVSSHC